MYPTFLGEQEMWPSPSRINCPVNQRVLEVLLLELVGPVECNNTWWCFLYCYFQPPAVFTLVPLSLNVGGKGTHQHSENVVIPSSHCNPSVQKALNSAT